jgi:hypothetical protein
MQEAVPENRTPPLTWVELRGFEPLTPSMRITVALPDWRRRLPSCGADLAGGPIKHHSSPTFTAAPADFLLTRLAGLGTGWDRSASDRRD